MEMLWPIRLSMCLLLQGDSFHRVNGDIGGLDSSSSSHGRESPNDFQPSPSFHSPKATDAPSPGISPQAAGEGQSLMSAEASEHRGGTEAALEEAGREEVAEQSTPPSRPTSLPVVSHSVSRSQKSDELNVLWLKGTVVYWNCVRLRQAIVVF